MFLLKRILCPIDFSDLSHKGLIYAASFAARYGSRLHVLHVVELPHLYDVSFHSYGVAPDRMPEEATQRAKELLRTAITDDIREMCREVEEELRTGKPFVEIIRTAREEDVDMIVLSAHGHGGFSKTFIGSTTERVVRKAPCPVLTVKPEGHEFVDNA